MSGWYAELILLERDQAATASIAGDSEKERLTKSQIKKFRIYALRLMVREQVYGKECLRSAEREQKRYAHGSILDVYIYSC
jgi:hypothetical protein